MASMLTTIDNPYNPFKDWDSWFAYDLQKGYRTCQILDKFAIDEIVKFNVRGIDKKVTDNTD